MEEFKWLVGEWTAENRVQATPTTPAYTDTYLYTYQLCEGDTRISITGPGGNLRPYLTFDPFTGRWMMTFVDGLYDVLQSRGWQDNLVVFAGHLTMLGIDCELRQTMTRRVSDEFHILNEEKLPDDRRHVVDEFSCQRK